MMLAHLAVFGLCTATAFGQEELLVFPPPQSMVASGPALSLHPQFSISSAHLSPILNDAIARYSDLAGAASANAATSPLRSSEPQLRGLHIDVDSGATEELNIDTLYNYTLHITAANPVALVRAGSIYGAMYALESFTQLLDVDTGSVHRSEIVIRDEPDYAWRGLMIDSGRRFFPMELVKNLMQTMQANKLNVLHLHASDHCRFGVESKLYPELTSSLTGIKAGHYTQEDIKDMIAYGKKLGIRVVPEFDMPGHSRGFLPLEKRGLQFCTSDPSRSQLFDDPAGKTYDLLHNLYKEMSALFTDDVFNIGADETRAKGKCTVNTSFAIERRMVNAIASEFKKTPEGWEELFFDAGAATKNTIVNAWARHNASSITSTGRKAVESASSHFYFTSPGPMGPAGWSRCWYDIGTGVPASQKSLLLGGEMSMWSDTYCNTDQCGSATGKPPVGHELFDPKNDDAFSKSIGGMIWPRGYVAAAAYWNFDSSISPSAPAFVSKVNALNDQLAKRGSFVCPTNCSCDQLTACGKPYLSN